MSTTYSPSGIVKRTEEIVLRDIKTARRETTRDIDTIVITAFQLSPLKELDDKETLILRMYAREHIENKTFQECLRKKIMQFRSYENSHYYNSAKPLITGIATTGIIAFSSIDTLEALTMTLTCGGAVGYIATKTWDALVRNISPLFTLATYFTEDGEKIRELQQEEKEKRKETIQRIQKIQEQKESTQYGVEIPYTVVQKLRWNK